MQLYINVGLRLGGGHPTTLRSAYDRLCMESILNATGRRRDDIISKDWKHKATTPDKTDCPEWSVAALSKVNELIRSHPDNECLHRSCFYEILRSYPVFHG